MDEAAAGGRAACERCGGRHTPRQRCPADPAPQAELTYEFVLTPPPPPRTLPAYAMAAPLPLPSPFPTRVRKGSSALGAMLAWIGGFIGTVVLWSAITVAGVLIWSLPQADVDVEMVLLAIGATAIIGVVFGMLVLWITARVYAKVSFAVLALVLLTGGPALMVAAPIVRQMNTPELAEYTGFTALLAFGLLTTALGAALAAMCIRWSMTRKSRRLLSRWSRLLGSAYGLVLSLLGIALLLLVPFAFGGNEGSAQPDVTQSDTETAITLAVLVAMTLVPGIILTYHGISASMGDGSGPFRTPIGLIALGLFALVLIVGQLMMRSEDPVPLPMAVMHVIAAILPAVALIGLAGRGSLFKGEPVRGLTWRQVTLAAAISMSVAVPIALYVESIGAVYAVFLLLAHNGAFEFAANAGEVFEAFGEADFRLTENEQFIVGLFTASVLAPLSEEFGKSLGVRFMMHANTTRAQCFLLGAFAGAGFGFLEALLYGLAAIGEDLESWWMIMLLRGGSTSLYVICTGLAGVGWWYWSRAKRHGVALSLFGIAVLIHAAWNAFATVLYSRILFLDTIESTLLDVISYTIIAAISLAMIVAIPIIARRLREHVAPVEGTPLGSMAPWLG